MFVRLFARCSLVSVGDKRVHQGESLRQKCAGGSLEREEKQNGGRTERGGKGGDSSEAGVSDSSEDDRGEHDCRGAEEGGHGEGDRGECDRQHGGDDEVEDEVGSESPPDLMMDAEVLDEAGSHGAIRIPGRVSVESGAVLRASPGRTCPDLARRGHRVPERSKRDRGLRQALIARGSHGTATHYLSWLSLFP